MQKVKAFDESSAKELELEINKWIFENTINVLSVSYQLTQGNNIYYPNFSALLLYEA